MVLRRAKLKIVVVGERAVGKTSLIQRYIGMRFSEQYKGTLGAQIYPVEVELPVDGGDLVLAKIAIFDLMGEHAARDAFRDAIFYGTHGVIAVCDSERPDTLYALQHWIRAAALVTGGVPFTIVLNKSDRTDRIAVGQRETAWVREQFPLAPLVAASALTGQGVEEAFHVIFARAIAASLEAVKARHKAKLLRHDILVFVAAREAVGVSKTELFARFKDVPAAEILQELDHLAMLEFLAEDAHGGKGLVQTSSMPAAARLRITPGGRKVVEKPSVDEMVVEEPS